MTTPPKQASVADDPKSAVLKVLVLGFNENERRLLHAIVKLSQRRKPALHLLEANAGHLADVILIDALDKNATTWADAQPWLADKPVGWVDTLRAVPPGHSKLDRPVQWPILPMLLSRILFRTGDGNTSQPAAETGTPAPPAGTTAAENLPETVQGKRVLVVDDSLTVRQQLQTFLEKMGLKPTLAEDGEAAVRACGTTRFDCILLDVLMPGLDGYETCRRIKALPGAARRSKVIMLTSRTSPFDRIRGKMAGCDAYLTKPIKAEKLRETLRLQL